MPAVSKKITLPLSIIASLVGAIALLSSWDQRRVHILSAVPYLLLLACPLMHLLMHRGHGRHGSSNHEHGGPSSRALS
jgi:hypothetical protein